MLSRRSFLQSTALVSFAPMFPGIFGSTARAAKAASEEKVLVVVQLDGGNDGINTVVPFGDDAYGKYRNKLRLETDKLHKLNDFVGLHPSMRGAKQLFDEGNLAIVQGVGYPNPSRSHFRSMKIWQTAKFEKAAHDDYGWLGRTLDSEQPTLKSGEANAIFLGEEATPVALWGRRSSALALARDEDLMLQLEKHTAQPKSRPFGGGSGLQQFVNEQFLTAYTASETFRRERLENQSAGERSYPDTALGSRLAMVSKLLKSNSPARVYYTIQSGYDTHATQLYIHSRSLREFSDAVQAFLKDLKNSGLDDRVLLLAFSEFGRRVKENDSQGTDHGTAGPVFLAGTSLAAGLHGKTPDLTDLEDGDLKMQTDFRSVYAAVLEQWLDVSPEQVLGNRFEKLPLLRT